MDKAGYIHEEVSNWALPGFSCRHNWLYWQGLPYIGIGPGAHGYLNTADPIGLRYAYHHSVPAFLNSTGIDQGSLEAVLERSGVIIDDRDIESWVFEYVGSTLRADPGISLARINKVTGLKFVPNGTVKQGLEGELLTLKENGYLVLAKTEWFRETRWAYEVAISFV